MWAALHAHLQRWKVAKVVNLAIVAEASLQVADAAQETIEGLQGIDLSEWLSPKALLSLAIARVLLSVVRRKGDIQSTADNPTTPPTRIPHE